MYQLCLNTCPIVDSSESSAPLPARQISVDFHILAIFCMSICLIFPSLNYFFATLNTEACQAWNSLFNSFLLGFNNNCQFLQPKFICLVIKRSKSKTKTYKLTICIFLEMCEWQFNETTESMRKTRSGHMFQRVINFEARK